MEKLLIEFEWYLMLFAALWMPVFIYYTIKYTKSGVEYVDALIDNLAKDPEKYKKISEIGRFYAGGGIFFNFSITYPFIRHRRRDKSRIFDLFMWLNFLWIISFFSVFFIE